MPDAGGIGLRCGRLRAREDRVPLSEAHFVLHRHDHEVLHERQRVQLRHVRALLGLLRRLRGERARSHQARAQRGEVPVVRHVTERIHAVAALAHREELLVGGGRAEVGERRIVVAARADVDVRGHVHQVARAGREVAQRVGELLRTRGIIGRFDRVDVVVDRADVLRIALEHRLDRTDDLRRVRVRLAARPVIPRREVHHRFGVHGLRVVVVGEVRDDVRHRIGVRLVERRTIGGRGIGVALRQRFDQRAVGGLRVVGERQRLLRECGRLRREIGRHRQVDVRPEHERLAPHAHRAHADRVARRRRMRCPRPGG